MSDIPTSAIMELVRRRRVQRVWSCGPRTMLELLDEIGSERGIGTVIDATLARYATLDPAVVRAVGARDWPRPILHLATTRRRS